MLSACSSRRTLTVGLLEISLGGLHVCIEITELNPRDLQRFIFAIADADNGILPQFSEQESYWDSARGDHVDQPRLLSFLDQLIRKTSHLV